MKRKNVTVLLVVVMCFLNVLVGCQKQKSEDVEVVQSASKDDISDKKILEYWTMWNETEIQGQVIKEAVDDFMKINPDIKVNITWCGREIRKTLQPALDKKEAVDIWDEDVERVVKNWGDYTLTLDDYVKKSYPTTGGKAYEECINYNLMNLIKLFSDDNTLKAVPYQAYITSFMYNKDHFIDAGITETPKTWEEFLHVCEKLKEKGHTPLTTDDAYADALIGYHLSRIKGYEWVEELVADKSKAMWDDEAVLQMAKDYEYLASQGYFSKNVDSNIWPAGQQEVASGDVTMYVNGSWLPNEVLGTTGPDFNWGQFSYPAVKDGVETIGNLNFGSQCYAINKECEYPEEAFRLIAHITTGEWDEKLATSSMGMPSSNDAEWPIQLQEAKGVLENATQWNPYGCGISSNIDLTPTIISNFQKLMSGELTAERFIEEMKK